MENDGTTTAETTASASDRLVAEVERRVREGAGTVSVGVGEATRLAAEVSSEARYLREQARHALDSANGWAARCAELEARVKELEDDLDERVDGTDLLVRGQVVRVVEVFEGTDGWVERAVFASRAEAQAYVEAVRVTGAKALMVSVEYAPERYEADPDRVPKDRDPGKRLKDLQELSYVVGRLEGIGFALMREGNVDNGIANELQDAAIEIATYVKRLSGAWC